MADVRQRAYETASSGQATISRPSWPGRLVGIGLIVVFVAVGLGLPAMLPIQVASWLTFVALVIAPGYLVGDLVTWRLDLDLLERLALAMPLGVFVMALPGMVAMLGHLTIEDLRTAWTLTVGVLVAIWLVFRLLLRERSARESCPPWSWDEIALTLLLVAAFVYIYPTLSLYKMDGDAYAVATFTADALTGRPLNATEPILGTGQSVGSIRMGFNQMLPVFHLWSYLSQIDHIELTGTASRSMLALWAILASYMLGKAAGNGQRRVGLLTAAIQTLVYIAAPFLRADHVGIFFFERINADKFTVTVTILPVVLALAIRYVRAGRREAWIAAAMSGFALSSIHALIAAMLALALGAFGGLHLLLHLRRREAWIRVGGLALLVAVVMILPLVQLVDARSGEAMAPTYPSSFEGWPVEPRLIPALPFRMVGTWDLYGPLPDLARLDAEQANTPTNPFLLWRFALNMRRQRIIVFDLNRYISDPTIILEPVYLLALLVLPLLLWRLRSDLGAQFALSSSLAVLFVMYNPILTPVLGAMVMPWILWRFVWLLPYALILALVADRLLSASVALVTRLLGRPSARPALLGASTLGLVLVTAVLLRQSILANLEEMQARGAASFVYATPERIIARLREDTALTGPVMVMADENLSVTIPAFVGNADIVAHRILSTSEMFPADQQDMALQRHLDQYHFFNTHLLTPGHIDILQRYDIRYVAVPSGTGLDAQLRLSPQWFEWLVTDQGYSLYAVRQLPTPTESLQGNRAFVDHQWTTAQQHYRSALEQDPADLLAMLGLADSYRIEGEFDQALETLNRALGQVESPVVHYRLGQVYADMGQVEQSIGEFDLAQRGAPEIMQYHLALGDACLGAADSLCAGEQFRAAVDTLGLADEAQRLTTLAAIWQQRAHDDVAVPLYEQAAALRPNEQTRLGLAEIYRRTEQYDQAKQLLYTLRQEHPFSVDVVSALARLRAAQGDVGSSLLLYRRAIWMQALLAQDARTTHLALAQTLLDADLVAGARDEIERVLAIQPHNASAYLLLGDLYRAEYEPTMAMKAYQYALQIDPTQAAAYTSLSDQQRQQAVHPDETLALMQRAVEFNPEQTILSLTLADQFRRLGDVNTAITMYQQALGWFVPSSGSPGLAPQLTGRSRALTYTRLAALYEDLGQIETAMNYYRAAVTATPVQPWTWVTLGDALRRRDDVAGAQEAYRTAMEQDPELADAYLHLASLVDDQGDPSAALALYDQGLQAALAGSNSVQTSRAWLALGSFYQQSTAAALPIGSDEAAAAQGDAALPLTERALAAHYQSLEAEESAAGVRALGRFLQDLDRTGEAIDLFKQRIQAGEEERWVPSLLAQYYVGLGDAYLDAGRNGDAVAAFRRATELDGWWSGARLALARGLLEQGDQAGALAELETAVEIVPGAVEAQVALADARDQAGDRERALDIYQATVQAHPGNVPANLALARAWQDRNQWERAEQSYRQAIAMVPGDAGSYLGLAALEMRRARYAEAEALLHKALQLDRGNVPAYLQLGDLLARQARHADALDAYYQAAQASPDGWQAHIGLAGIYRALGQSRQAVESLWSAAAADGAPATPYLQLAEIFQEQNQPDQAEQTLLSAVDRLPGDPAIRQALANFYQSMGRGTEALRQLQLGVEENPGSMALWVSYADLLRLYDHEKEAQAVYEQAAKLGEPDAAGRLALAAGLRAQGRSGEALAVLNQAIASGPADAGSWVQKGQTQMQLGDLEAGWSSLKQATGLAPAEGRIWSAVGSALLSVRRFQEAASALEQAIAVEPSFLPAYGTLIEAYGQLGQSEQAARVVRLAQTAAPGNYLGLLYAARALREAQQWDEARTALGQAMTSAPGSAQVYLEMAQLEQEQGNEQKAADGYRQAINLRPGDPTAHLGLVDQLLAEGDLSEALAGAQAALAVRPGDSDLLLRLGRIQRILGEYAEAEATLKHAVHLDLNNDNLQAELGLLYQAQGKSEEALAAYETAATLRPDQAAYPLALSRLWSGQGRPEQAVAVLQHALPHVSRPAPLYVALSELYTRRGDPALALEVLNQGRQAAGEDVQLLQAIAAAHQAQASFDQADQVVRALVAQHPEDAASFLASAAGHLSRGRAAEALVDYQQAVQLDPGNANVYLALGNAQRLMGNLDEATASYTQALALAPRLEDAYMALASVYRRQGHWEQAGAIYERGLAVAPASGPLLIEYSDLLFQRGDEEAALGLLARATRLAASARTYLARAALYRVLGRAAEAEADLDTALQIEPGSVEALVARGDLYRSRGETAEAKQAYERAAALEPGGAAAHLALADLAYTQGQVEEAQGQFEAANKAAPASPVPVIGLAGLRADQGEWEEVEADYRRALELAPATTEAYVGLADLVQRRTGKLADALTWLQQASVPGVDLGTIYRTTGEMVAGAAQSALAGDYFQQAVEREPAMPEGYLAQANLALAQGLPEKAEGYASAAAEIAPLDPAVHIVLGDIDRARGETAAAASHYQEAIGLNAVRTDGTAALAELYFAEEQYTKAATAYEEAIARAPLDWPLWVSLGNVYVEMKEYSKARSAYERAAEMNPAVAEPWLGLGDQYVARKKWKSAQAAYEKARALRPNLAEPVLRLASLYEERNNLSQAKRYARQAIEIDPAGAGGYLALGRIQSERGKTSDAAEAFLSAIQRDPRRLATYNRWMGAYTDIKRRPYSVDRSRLKTALARLAKTDESKTVWGQVLLGLGTLTLEGDTGEAIDYLEQASRLDPAFGGLYQELAMAYEEELRGRPALDSWYRYFYATGGSADTAEAKKHIDALSQVRVDQPADGSPVSGVVKITGTAAGKEFRSYTVKVRPAGQSTTWSTIGQGSSRVEKGTLATWNTAGLSPGTYRLRLSVVNTKGKDLPYDEITVEVEASP